ncbi:hypothetical protein F5879DRAFT_810736 [Lentinula edodes]|nr:hypothetical protein F5879DRAFT_810736 [Lentinula edodes]
MISESGLDYALALRGGAVVVELTSETMGIAPLSGWERWLSYVSIYPDSDRAPPLAVLEQDIHVGYCWAFSGRHGHIALALLQAIIVTDFTIFYPSSAELTSNELQQVPKAIQLWALVADEFLSDSLQSTVVHWSNFSKKNRKPSPLRDDQSFELLANISYSLDQGIKQTFSVDMQAVATATTIVVVQVLDNWGSDVTCLYRIAVHGVPEL